MYCTSNIPYKVYIIDLHEIARVKQQIVMTFIQCCQSITFPVAGSANLCGTVIRDFIEGAGEVDLVHARLVKNNT